MNTVLDDNKKLCLSSGKVLMLTPLIKILFEVEDLTQASPATVSRCGMVYMEPENLDLNHLVTSYLRRLPLIFKEKSKLLPTFGNLISKYLFKSLEYVFEHSIFVYDIKRITVVEGFLKLLDTMLVSFYKLNNSDAVDTMLEILEDTIVFSSIWSVGALGDLKSRRKFNDFFRKELLAVKVKNEDLFAVEFDVESKCWVDWNDRIKGFEIEQGMQFHEIVVPTVSFTRNI